ncbi:16S rRNA (cytosine(967)-C(5))-methyltransferase RsmB [Gilvimarinus algae]|uniref:16S rRNA (cytosine(967)-C(5))-methyltransferase n=1 Tax=Gilvimarinus algae TaxID=3058037 RepID=A0ABT8TC70_9GAMM|nr:16S rRNA (cytosine(967)-C(5))-methyltransferase RsmB [Gilvimarinus sp. SDUM040014]MDO3381704.1 16S rRNA (cytosine(967)-C(5))-methyltransferase RsmB [Gilvimarinus sp. SDUM040014]
MTPRLACARALAELLRQHGSLASSLPQWQEKVAPNDRALVRELCYGTMRYYPRLRACLNALLEKPLRGKDGDVLALMLLGLYQLDYTRIPDHAAIGETAGCARALKKPWATGLINGVLRRYQRERDQLAAALADDRTFCTAHPQWLLEAIEGAWPDQAGAIIEANNAHPPLTLRLNTRTESRDQYLQRLSAAGLDARPTDCSEYGFTLASPCDPKLLPGFTEGLISVQDEAAQLAAPLLDLAPGLRVLDACAAPGGKTGHILQSEPRLSQVTALDIEQRRLKRVTDNLQRLGVEARVVAGDAAQPNSWWDGQLFDRILLDAPCSATGIIRRQSDIKLLRSADDITRLARVQGQLLDALWPLVKPGGILLYATCSVLPEENSEQAKGFLQRSGDVQTLTIDATWGLAQDVGRQLLPQANGHDGFYYAKFRKIAK